MNEIELLKKYQNSFPVPELSKMLGIGKTESYWILKHRDIQTITLNGQIRIMKNSFWEWYGNQTKYRIQNGPEPGEKLKADSYSARDIMALLGVSKYSAYRVMEIPALTQITIDYQKRITKESFDRWYPTQSKYRLAKDRAANNKIMEETYSLPDIKRMLGLHRNKIYYIMDHPKNQTVFDFIEVAGQKRVTISSFERWYASQNRYKKIESSPDKIPEVTTIEDSSSFLTEKKEEKNDACIASSTKNTYRLEDLMSDLGVSRKNAYKLIQTGELIAIKSGKSYIIPEAEYKRYIKGRNSNGIYRSEE